jgi:hypothetical protein
MSCAVGTPACCCCCCCYIFSVCQISCCHSLLRRLIAGAYVCTWPWLAHAGPKPPPGILLAHAAPKPPPGTLPAAPFQLQSASESWSSWPPAPMWSCWCKHSQGAALRGCNGLSPHWPLQRCIDSPDLKAHTCGHSLTDFQARSHPTPLAGSLQKTSDQLRPDLQGLNLSLNQELSR